MENRVVIIGAGLAGMTCALELAKRGVKVVILEGGERVGGKAGADRDAQKKYQEHGYHVFPGWYRNTRALLRELGVYRYLIDIDRFWYLKRPANGGLEKKDDWRRKRLLRFEVPSSPSRLYGNLTVGLSPLKESLLSMYYQADLCAESFSKRAYLDRVSSTGFLRSRRYATEKMAQLHYNVCLQSSSIPSYEISAMTLQKIGLCWMEDWMASTFPRWLTGALGIPAVEHGPIFFSILNGNLQEKFIDPFAKRLEKLGVKIKLNHKVASIRHGVTGLELMTGDGERVEPVGGEPARMAPIFGDATDVYVVATPHLDTSAMLDDLFLVREDNVRRARLAASNGAGSDTSVDEPPPGERRQSLADLTKLRSVPMAAMHLYFNERVAGIPKEHVMFLDSDYAMSFIDVSQHWSELKGAGTVLSVIAANFEPLTGISEMPAIASELYKELCFYIPALKKYRLRHSDEEPDGPESVRYWVNPNKKTPLFLNTIGAWQYRPTAKTHFDNLFVAGDYCRSEADLTTMESAVMSGITTAGAVLQALGHDVPLEPIQVAPRAGTKWLARQIRTAGYPPVFPVSAYNLVKQQLGQLRGNASEVVEWLRKPFTTAPAKEEPRETE